MLPEIFTIVYGAWSAMGTFSNLQLGHPDGIGEEGAHGRPWQKNQGRSMKKNMVMAWSCDVVLGGWDLSLFCCLESHCLVSHPHYCCFRIHMSVGSPNTIQL